MDDNPIVALWPDQLALLESAIVGFGVSHPEIVVELEIEIDAPPFQGESQSVVYEAGEEIERRMVHRL